MDGPHRGYGLFCFGDFRLDPVSRTLLHAGTRLHLSARLFDTLLYLVQHHDRLVERDELCRAVWSTQSVSEGSLGRAISSLRLALKSTGEEGLIVTAPGRGYRFGRPVWSETVAPPEPTRPVPLPAPAAARAAHPALLATIAATLALLALLAVALRPHPAFAPPPYSIAVLPFVNQGAAPAGTLYSDGIAQELINALGRIDGLKVAASTSSFLFRDTHATIGEIARQLDVGVILEGSVQRAPPHLHVTVELIDARSGYQLWSHAYDQDQGDILAMQGEIATAAVTTLKGVILGPETAQLTLGGTTNLAAFDAYLNGTTALHAMDPQSNRRAIADFNQAVALDPRYALAFADRALALSFIGVFGNSPDVDYSHRVMAAALDDGAHAVALAPDLGAAHADLALVLQSSLTDLGRADAEYRQAIALAPGDAAILLNYGRFRLEMGDAPAGIAAAEKAAALDPLAARTYGNLAIILAYARRYDEARQAVRRALVLDPDNATFRRTILGMLETAQGHAQAAQNLCAGNLDYRDMMCLALADHMLGRQADALAELTRMRAVLGDNGAFLYARIYAQWGQAADALQWLQTAYRLRDPGLIELKIDPALDPIRGTPEYKHLLDALGFPAP